LDLPFKINVEEASLPHKRDINSGVNLARASEAKFIEVKRKPLRNEGQGP